MPDEQTEQIPDAGTEQSAPVAEQAEPVAVSEAGAVADPDAGAVAERPVEVDWSRPDDVRGVLERPEYKGIRDLLEEQRLNSENTARQRFEAELRRAAASDEVLAADARNLASVWGVEPDDERLVRHIQTFDQPRATRIQTETNRRYYEEATAGFPEEAKGPLALAWQQAGDDIEVQNSLVGQVIALREQMAVTSHISDLSLEQIPESSKLRKEIDERVAKQVEAEIAARDREAGRIDVAPRASSGGPIGGTRAQEIDDTLRTASPGSQQYQDAYREKYGFAMPVR